jgi:hypothetical protein
VVHVIKCWAHERWRKRQAAVPFCTFGFDLTTPTTPPSSDGFQWERRAPRAVRVTCILILQAMPYEEELWRRWYSSRQPLSIARTAGSKSLDRPKAEDGRNSGRLLER